MRTYAQYSAVRPSDPARRALRTHAWVYALVNAMLFVIDAMTPGGWWFFWPLLAWGLGLLSQATVVLSGGTWPGEEW